MGHEKTPTDSEAESIARREAAAGAGRDEALNSGLVSISVHKDAASASDAESRGATEAVRSAGELASKVAGGAREVAVDLAHKGVDAASAATAQASDLVSHATNRAARSASDFASNVAEGVRGVAGDLADKGADAASAATARAQSLAAQLEAAARRNPLGAILGAFAIGAVIGLRRRR